MANYDSILKKEFDSVSLEDIAAVLKNGLQKIFSHAEVEVVDCPDLTQSPWNLAAPGLGGKTSLLDVGGVPNLIPLPDLSKIYNFDEIAKAIDHPNAFFIGAGAGGHHIVGVNSEMMANLRVGKEERLKSYVATVDKETGKQQLHSFPHKEFALLGNFLASDGCPGKVLKVTAQKRTGDGNFISCMREALVEEKTKSIGLGGVFLIRKGKAKLHVMPPFSSVPLNSDEDVENWLNFYEMSAPLVCLSTFVSSDMGIDLRVAHTHCFSDHNEGGHYHYDVTPDIIEYEGYFTPASTVYHIDPPTATHQIGRD